MATVRQVKPSRILSRLSQTELILPHDSAWLLAWRTQKKAIYSLVVSPAERGNTLLAHQLSNQLQQLKRDYIQEYQTLHVRSRLGNQASTQKQQLQADSRLKDLRSLAAIKVVNVDQLNRWDNDLVKIKECYKLTDSDLQSSPLCPHCGFKPSNEPYTVNAEQSLQDKELLKEFETYRQTTTKKIKEFRIEAIRAGFKQAWIDKDYRTIADVAKKLPDSVIQEDEKLLLYHDNALNRLGED